jgi:uncharacterized membrane protein
VDHKEQHHQHHVKEREQHVREHKAHEHRKEKDLGPIHPLWFLVLGTVLTCLAVLSWILFW